MKKIIIIIVVVLVVGILGFSLLGNKATTPGDNTPAGSTGINFKNFNPFGSKSTPSDSQPPEITPGDETPGETPEENLADLPVLRQITKYPVSGLTSVEETRVIPVPTPEGEIITETPIGTTTPTKPIAKPATEIVTAVRYVERSTGHLKEMFTDRKDEIPISNTTIPGIQEAYFTNNGKNVIYRYIKESTGAIQTFAGTVPAQNTDGTPGELKGSFLPENIPFLTVSPDTLKIFYGEILNNTYQGSVASFLGDKKVAVYASAFTEWIPDWVGKSSVVVTTKATGVGLGYTYKINTEQKKIQKVLGGILGMTSLLSPDEKMLIYSQTGNNGFALNMYDITKRLTTPMQNTTMPEKCIFSKKSDALYCGIPSIIPLGLYPDDWYQGVVSFSDTIWKIDPHSGLSQQIIDPSIASATIDLLNPTLSEKEDYLFFMNKSDSTLWSLDLAPETHVPPAPLANPTETLTI